MHYKNISTDSKVIKINQYLGEMGWTEARVFFNKVIQDLEENGDNGEFMNWLNNKPKCCTVYLRDEVMDKYKKYSKINKKFDSNLHFNNWTSLDSAGAK